MASDAESTRIWNEAKAKGIILVPWKSPNSKANLCGAISEDFLDAVLKKLGHDPNGDDAWDHIWGLGLGFFVDHGAPGIGDTLAESYTQALAKYNDWNQRARNTESLKKLKEQVE